MTERVGGPSARGRAGAQLLATGPRTAALAGLLAFCPALIAWFLVLGLNSNRTDLAVPTAPLVVFVVGVTGWVTLLGMAARIRTWPRTAARPPAGDRAVLRLALPLVAAVYLLVAFGVLTRLRLAGLGPAGDDAPLTGLALSLGVGAVGLVALAGQVRSAAPDSLIGAGANDLFVLRGRGWIVLGAALILVVFSGIDRGEHGLWRVAGQAVRPAALMPFLLLTVFAMLALILDLQSSDGGPDRDASRRLTAAMVVLGLGLVAGLDPRHPEPAAAVVAGAAVFIAVVTHDRWWPLAGCAVVIVGYGVITFVFDAVRERDVFASPYSAQAAQHTADVGQHAALAIARGGYGGDGPGLGLVESYAAEGGGVVPDRFALNVIAEELGVAVLWLVLFTAVVIGLLAVQLARRCGKDGVGAWARGLAAVIVVMLALPVLPLVWPGFGAVIALPGVAPDGVYLVALLWAVGALVGAAGRAARVRRPRHARAAAPGGSARARPSASAMRWDPRLAAVGCVICLVVVLPVAAFSAADQRHRFDPVDAQAVGVANSQRPGQRVGWGPDDGLDAVTKAAVDAALGHLPRCPARSSASALDGSCIEPTVTLDHDAQRAALAALERLQPSVAGSVVAVNVDDGALRVLAAGSEPLVAPQKPALAPTLVPTLPPTLAPTLAPTAAPTAASTPGAPTGSAGSAGSAGGRADPGPSVSSSRPGPDDGGGEPRDPDVAGGAQTQPAVRSLFRGSRDPGVVTVSNPQEEAAPGWRAAVSAGDLGQQLVLSGLQHQPSYQDAARRAWENLREVEHDSEEGACFTPPENPGERTMEEAEAQPVFRGGPSCGKILAELLTASDPKSDNGLSPSKALEPLKEDFDLAGAAGRQLTEVGLLSEGTAQTAGISVDDAACRSDLSACLSVSPLQVAVLLAGLVALDDDPRAQVPAPIFIRGQPAASRRAISGAGLEENLLPQNQDARSFQAADGRWSVRVLRDKDGKAEIVLVTHLRAGGSEREDAAAVKQIEDAVAGKL